MFPAMMLVIGTLIFEPDWPLRFWPKSKQAQPVTAAAPESAPAAAKALSPPDAPQQIRRRRLARSDASAANAPLRSPSPLREKGAARQPALRDWLILLSIFAFLAFNALLPIRYLQYPGDVAWHEHGHRFSWRMKLRHKECNGYMELVDPVTNVTRRGDLSWLSSRQMSKMWARPEMIVQYAHYLADREEAEGHRRPRVVAGVRCSLNYRGAQPYIEPRVDLAATDPWKWPYSFIEPLRPLTEEQRADFLWRRLWTDPASLLRPLPKKPAGGINDD